MQVKFYARDHLTDTPNSHITMPPEGMPFVMNGLLAETTLNHWLLSLPGRGCESPTTWKNYATEMKTWAEFLQRNNRTYLDDPKSLKDLFLEYRMARLSGGDPHIPNAITRTSWNTKLAAHKNFYDWANSNDVLNGYPFDLKTASVKLSGGGVKTVTKNSAAARTGRKNATIKYLAPDYIDTFVNVGMKGLLPNGSPDPDFSGRNAQRNAVMAQTLFSTGLRVNELANLLVWEVPSGNNTATDNVPLKVPGVIAKGGTARTTWIAGGSLSDLNGYIRTERMLTAAGASWTPSSPLRVEAVSATGVRLNGRHSRFGAIAEKQRRRLLDEDGASGVLFLASGGAPISVDSIQSIFLAASERCRIFDPAFPYVNPHMARHSFAVNTLRTLIRRALIKLAALDEVLGEDARKLAHRISYDPLLVVRDLMGHTSVATTQIYLDIINPESLITEEELALLMGGAE